MKSPVGLVRTPTAQSGPRVLSEENESVRAIRALEQQVNEEAAWQRAWKAAGRDIVVKETP